MQGPFVHHSNAHRQDDMDNVGLSDAAKRSRGWYSGDDCVDDWQVERVRISAVDGKFNHESGALLLITRMSKRYLQRLLLIKL